MKDMQLFLDDCARKKETVSIVALKKDGTKMELNGWVVISGHWQKGTHDFRNPVNGQIRKVKDLLVFCLNGHPVYI